MLGAPDLPHPTMCNRFDQLVASHMPGVGDFAPDSRLRHRWQHRDHGTNFGSWYRNPWTRPASVRPQEIRDTYGQT